MNLKQFANRLSVTVLLVMAAMAIALTAIADRLTLASSKVVSAMESVRASEEIQISLLSHNKESFLYGLKGDAIHAVNFEREAERLHYWLARAAEYVEDADERRLLEEVDVAVQHYLRVRRELLEAGTAPVEAYEIAVEPMEIACERAERLTDLNVAQAERVGQRAQTVGRITALAGLAAVLVGVVTFPFLWLAFRRRLYLPLITLTEQLRGLHGSAMRVDVPDDAMLEIKQISLEFNELAARLSEQARTRLRFLAAVAHDLRNPLSAIQISTEVLKARIAENANERDLVDIVLRQSMHLNRLVSDLLDSSRIEAGHLDIISRRVNMCALLSDATSLFQNVSMRHRINLRLSEPVVTCECDPERISQVLNNLLSNAIKYSPHGGAVDVALATCGDHLTITVADEGIGISAEERERIFEPFRRSKATEQTIPGVGLGLSVSRKIVEAHGGRIDVQSGEAAGSAFVVRLPLRAEAVAAAPAGSAPGRAS